MATGTPSGAVLIVRDVTGPYEVEELKDEMLSVAPHELRTPVTVIRAQAQLLRRGIRFKANTLDEIDDGLAMIVDETERLTKLLALLLDLSRMQAGRFEADRHLVNLGDLARIVWPTFSRRPIATAWNCTPKAISTVTGTRRGCSKSS